MKQTFVNTCFIGNFLHTRVIKINAVFANNAEEVSLEDVLKKPKTAKKWIADCGDPFMGAKLETFRKPFYFKYFEKDFCRKADYITVPAEGAKKAYYSEFLGKIRVIPQGFNFKQIENR